MARPNKANYQSSKLKILTLGDADRTLILPESGANIIITAAATAARTITLPSIANIKGAKGAYFRIIWGVASDASETIIKTGSTTEYIVGTALFFDSDTAANGYTGSGTNPICGVKSTLSDESTQLSVHDNIEPGSMIELLSDGSNWYISNSKVIATEVAAFA